MQYHNEAKPHVGACRSLSIATLTSWPRPIVLQQPIQCRGTGGVPRRTTGPRQQQSFSNPLTTHSHPDPFGILASRSTAAHPPTATARLSSTFTFVTFQVAFCSLLPPPPQPASDIHPPTRDIPIIHHYAALPLSTHPPQRRRSAQNPTERGHLPFFACR